MNQKGYREVPMMTPTKQIEPEEPHILTQKLEEIEARYFAIVDTVQTNLNFVKDLLIFYNRANVTGDYYKFGIDGGIYYILKNDKEILQTGNESFLTNFLRIIKEHIINDIITEEMEKTIDEKTQTLKLDSRIIEYQIKFALERGYMINDLIMDLPM